MDISVVVPLYNEEESVPELLEWIARVMEKNGYSYEVILVDDGSSDGSWEVIQKQSAIYNNIRGIRFRRNYGKSAALFCGFEVASGNVVITMDADLQDSPEEIPGLYNMIINERYDMVSGWKKERHDPLSKTIPSRVFNFTARITTGIKLHDFNCGLKAYRKDVVKSIEVYGEMHRYLPVMVKKAGFSEIGEKIVEHRKRKYGVTKFGFERFMKGFLDLLSLTFVLRFGKRPMHLFGTLGTVMFIIGFLTAAWLGAEKLYYLYRDVRLGLVTDSPYFFIALTAMVIGSQLFLAGFLGELITRNSPYKDSYLIEEKINL